MSETPKREVPRSRKSGDATLKEYKRQYHIKNRDKINAKVKAYYRANRDKRLAYGREWRIAHSDRMKGYRQKHVLKLKEETFNAYGGRVCRCCGEIEPKFLTIDHVEGGGNIHRKSLGSTGGKDFYSWLRQEGFPKGYQVLCFNCNLSKGHYGVCPHTIAPL